ncbi:MAG: hypothetical protein AB9842_04055 [Bacteroidales bacterium]
MKTLPIHKKGIQYYIVSLLILGFSLQTLNAQDQKSSKNKKEAKKSMRIKVITKDDDGKVKNIDTIFRYGGSGDDSVIIREIFTDNNLKEIAEQLKEMEITLDLEMDSLDSLTKEITATVMMDDFPLKGDLNPYEYFWQGEGHDPELLPDRNARDWCEGMSGHRKMFYYPPQQENQGWTQGYTPWGKIREIKVKDKKRGKKVVIRTEDPDYFEFMSPPIPPAPPLPPQLPKMDKKVKKIIIEKED